MIKEIPKTKKKAKTTPTDINYIGLVIATNINEAKNFASLYSGKVPNLTLKTTSIYEFASGQYQTDHHIVFVVLTRFTTQERLKVITPMLQYYCAAPITFCLVNQSISEQIKIPPELAPVLPDYRIFTCGTLTEVIPSVSKIVK